jgi:hypothetical protein
MFAVAWGVQSRDRAQALALAMDRVVLRALAGVLLAAVAVYYLSGRKARRARTPAGHAGLALWSFMMSTAHGAGLMLVPALIPLCMGDAPDREITAFGSLTLALAAVGVHTAAMLAVTGVIASVVCRGFDAVAHLLQNLRRKSPPAPR